jgi:hypothetical protein
LQGIYEVAQEATSTARAIVQLRERHRALIASEFRRSSGAASQLLEHLYRRPIVTVRGVADLTHQTFANANQLVARFQQHGILRPMTKQARNRRFVYTDYLEMFAGDELRNATSEASSVDSAAL